MDCYQTKSAGIKQNQLSKVTRSNVFFLFCRNFSEKLIIFPVVLTFFCCLVHTSSANNEIINVLIILTIFQIS